MNENNLSAISFQQNLPNGNMFDLILIEGGSFNFGKQNHEIMLMPFYLGKYPVTQQVWYSVINDNPEDRNKINHPVENISWYDSAAFCNALNNICGYPAKYYLDKNFNEPLNYTVTKYLEPEDYLDIHASPLTPGYRLPSESEWEYAARGGKNPHLRSDYMYPGGNKLDVLCWHRDNNHNETKPVGLKLANELNLFDMGGNVAEWCEDQYTGVVNQVPKDGSAWKTDLAINSVSIGKDDTEKGIQDEKKADKKEDFRIVRGGGSNCKSKSRSRLRATLRLNFQGFRLAFSPVEKFKMNP